MTLPRPLARRLSVEARTSGRAASAIVRDALQEYFAKQKAPPLPSFAGIGASGRADVSERAEELIGARVRRKGRE
ncbi:MAG: hypothetical protein WDA71_04365 [Actinomycetota bacterium]